MPLPWFKTNMNRNTQCIDLSRGFGNGDQRSDVKGYKVDLCFGGFWI